MTLFLKGNTLKPEVGRMDYILKVTPKCTKAAAH